MRTTAKLLAAGAVLIVCSFIMRVAVRLYYNHVGGIMYADEWWTNWTALVVYSWMAVIGFLMIVGTTCVIVYNDFKRRRS